MKFRSDLWRHRDFLNVWAAETISVFGSQFYLVAMPLAAILALDASPADMGLLFAIEMSPFLLVGLLAGVLADRKERRKIMIICDFGRAFTLAVIPVAWYFNTLNWPIMFAVAFAAGVFTTFFDIAYQAYLPVLVKRNQLLDANSKLETSRATSQVAGPGSAGLVVDIVGAPFALIADSVSFVASAILLLRVKKREIIDRMNVHEPVVAEIREGLRIVFSNPTLRGIAGCTSTSNLFGSMSFALMVLFMADSLQLSSIWIGAIFMVGAVGGVTGALISPRFTSRIGLGKAIIVSAAFSGIPVIALILAYPSNALIVFMPMMFVAGLLTVIYNVNQVSLRQAITPDHLQGKMNATMRFLVWGVFPIGGLIGGYLGEIFGIKTAILISGIGILFSFIWLTISKVHQIETIPEYQAAA
ncbi:MAG: MFS transporter [Methanobacteriota archaeon]|nr:MAG: MFS transporter [Euryarchaeota archaeon]